MAAVPSIGRAARVERPVARVADAATELYERYAGQIFGYCLHQLGSREEAEDAVQTTFMNAFRGLARGIVPDAEQAWLFKIAHNVCLSRRRSSWRRGRVEAPNNMEVLQEIVPAKEKVSDELLRLQDVLEEMPENQRRAILLREWQGLSYREIADELELSQAAVETLIFRARRALALGLEQTPPAPVWRTRVRHGANLGSLAALVKAVFGGGGAAAVKVAATVAAATTAAAVAVTEGQRHAPPKPPATNPAPVAATPDTSPAPAKPITTGESLRLVQPDARTKRREPPTPAVRARVHKLAAPAASTPAADASATRPAAMPETAAPTRAPAPTPPPAPAPPAAEQMAVPAPPGAHGNSAHSPRSPSPPATHGPKKQEVAPPATAPIRGNGHANHHAGDNQARVATTPAAAAAPGNSGDHGTATAPGQQDKAANDTAATPQDNGNGNGNGNAGSNGNGKGK